MFSRFLCGRLYKEVEILEKRLESSEEQIGRLRFEMNSYVSRINYLETNMNAIIKQLVNEEFSRYECYFEQLAKDIEERNKRLVAQQISNIDANYKYDINIATESLKNDLETQRKVYEEKIEALKAELNKSNARIDVLENQLIPQKPPVPVPPKLDFGIEGNNVLACKNSVASAKEFLEKATDIQEIIDFLEQSNNEKKDIFLKMVRKYIERLSRKIQKFDFEDEDELSITTTEMVMKFLKDDIFNNVMIAIYNGFNASGQTDENKKFYAELLQRINSYLKILRVYTAETTVGSGLTNDDKLDYNIFYESTDDANKNGIIRRIERLPYYINYLDGNELQKMCVEGQLIAWKYLAK